jgi:hypothetical protein
MSGTEITELPVKAPEINEDKAYKLLLQQEISEESQVIVNCSITGVGLNEGIRIWKSTFLYEKGSTRRSKLVHHHNIAFYPNWTILNRGETIRFTLIFTGLSRQCEQFDMIEKIPESGGFEVRNIQRNQNDVYSIDLTE